MLDAKHVRESLDWLSTVKPDVFGAMGHHFLLNPPLLESEVFAFERQHDIRLPSDYRHFLTAIGNGGAGPFYGVFPLGKWDGAGHALEAWRESDGVVGVLSKPFPLDDAWNDLHGKPPNGLLDTDEQDYWNQFDEFDRRYFDSSLVNGAIPISHEGCALRVWLVVTGSQLGRLWHDGRSEYSGLKPMRLEDGSPTTFSPWYSEWLENALRQARLPMRQS